MKSMSTASLIVGFLAGSVIIGGLMLAVRRAESDPVPARSSEKPPPPEPVPDLSEENRELKQRIVELERDLKALSQKDANALPPDSPSPQTLQTDFDELAAMGLSGIRGPKTAAFVERLKQEGDAGRRFLLDIVRNAGTTTERFIAAGLLAALGNPQAVPGLAGLLERESDMVVRRIISHAIAVLGSEAGQGALRKAMTSDVDWGVRVNSAYGLAKQGQGDGRKYLEEAYLSGDTPAEYRLSILDGLADVAALETAPMFRQILQDTQDAGYLLLAIGALAKMKDAASIGALEQVVISDLPESVKEAAQMAVEEIRKP